jgi:PAS domain S-box-containing protein
VLGYAPETLKGKSSFSLIHPEDAPAVIERFKYRAQRPGVGELIEYRCLHKNGTWRVLESIGVDHLDDPKIAGIVINVRDVTERAWTAEHLQRSLDALVAIHDAGRSLGSSVAQEAIGLALLESARRVANIEAGIVFLRNARGQMRVWQTLGPKQLWGLAQRAHASKAARRRALLDGGSEFFRLPRPDSQTPDLSGWSLPLRGQERVIGIVEVYGSNLAEESTGETLGTLAGQAASALERVRLYRDLAEREARLEQLVGQLMAAQEEERHRIAYEVHDGLAQFAVGVQQHLETLAAHSRLRNVGLRDDLNRALELARRAVGEARRVIAGLRPITLDVLGVGPAIELEIEALRVEGWQIAYDQHLGTERLLPQIETGLFRVLQEALTNVRKHAGTTRVHVTLERHADTITLEVRDWGRGFRPATVLERSGPSERVGVVGMQERIALLGGRCTVRSRPGAGTHIAVDLPLREPKSEMDSA